MSEPMYYNENMTDREVITLLLTNMSRLIKDQEIVRWGAVKKLIGHGAGFSCDFCRRYNVDPDEVIGDQSAFDHLIEEE